VSHQKASLNGRERLGLAINGEEMDRPPVSLWRHFPDEDQTAEGLANATLHWQDSFEFDFIKFMPPGDYPTIDWGAESQFEGSPGGTRRTTTFPVNSAEDWELLGPVDVERGFNGVMLDAVQATRARLYSNVPLLQTIFSPLSIAMKLSNGRAVEYLSSHPDLLQGALKIITSVTTSVLQRSIERGADGVFFASQCADSSVMSEKSYRESALPFDLEVLSALPGDAFLMIHLHGAQPMLDLHDSYPVGMLNWHDRRFGPPLSDIQSRSGRCVAGGIDEQSIVTDTPQKVAESAISAIEESDARSVVVAPGCVIPVGTPMQNVESAVNAVKSWSQT
jgi:uroporphyrinogen decarboxylase